MVSGNWEEKFFGNLASDEPKFGRAKRLRVFSDKNWHRGSGRPLSPATPPYMRVRIRRFSELSPNVTRHPRTVVRCTGCVYGTQPRLSPAAEDGAGAVAIPRAADRRTRPGDRQSAPSAPRRPRAASGGAGAGRGFSDPDPCRSRAHGSDLSFGEASLLVGGRLPGRRRERRRELQPPIPTGQPPHAAPTQSGRECRREGQRKYLRNCLSALGPAPRTQPSHRGHCPSTVSVDLVDPAPGSPLRRTGPSRHQTIEATPHRQNDPPTPKPRLSDRTTESSTQPSTSAVIFEPVDSKCAVERRGIPARQLVRST